VNDEGVVGGDLLEEVDVAGDEGGLGDDADAEALLAGEDFEERAGDAYAALYGLVWVGGGADGDLFGWIDGAEFLLEEPGGVFFEVDLVLEGEGPGLLRDVEGAGRGRVDGGGLEELVGIAGKAVFAAELAAAVGVDGPVILELAFGDGAVEDGAWLEGAEFDLVAVVGVGGLGGKACHAEEARAGVGVKDGEEGVGSEFDFRHFFASLEMRVGGRVGVCQEGLLVVRSPPSWDGGKLGLVGFQWDGEVGEVGFDAVAAEELGEVEGAVGGVE